MLFLDRIDEMKRLDAVVTSKTGGLVVLYGRRRIGKTRLLLEWSAKHGGLYTVADQSSPEIQRRYFAEATATRLAGFADVDYRDWRGLLVRLAREAQAASWRGPVIIDELPYLVAASPELPSVLQAWIDHEAKAGRLVVAVAGSSQRMMQGLVLSSNAPLYGRAREVLELGPLDPTFLPQVFRKRNARELVELYAAWGGVPRYWELAEQLGGDVRDQIDQLVLDPLAPLHREPDRMLIEEVPSALEVRPVLDAIGAGAHRVSEIGARVGRPATSMSRPLERLLGMGLVRRDIPFGESERKSRRSLYLIDDPFFRLWFRVVAPNRARLASCNQSERLTSLNRHWDRLVAEAWEDLCRKCVARLPSSTRLGLQGPWQLASRWWSAALPEWDLISESVDRRKLLLGEAKWSARPIRGAALQQALRETVSKPAPALPEKYRRHTVVRALFVPEADGRAETATQVQIATLNDLLRR
jgi:hypothetical protein